MPTVKFFARKINIFFKANYPLVCFSSITTLGIVGFFHYQLTHYNRDLIYWKQQLDRCYNEIENFALLLILFIVLIKIFFLVIIICINSRSMNWVQEITILEAKKRYATYLFIRLLADIDAIEEKHLRKKKRKDLTIRDFVLAHNDMQKVVNIFRKDARKLTTPSEIEVSLPVEEVYGLLEEEIIALRRTRFYNMKISVDEEFIKSLVNPG